MLLEKDPVTTNCPSSELSSDSIRPLVNRPFLRLAFCWFGLTSLIVTI
jgi:hypothetical protein